MTLSISGSDIGLAQHTIAASYDVNQSRVNDVLNERLQIGSKAVAATKRP
jgi:predicted XRE-type DNA-binding protein